ncbi:hypothetical protein ACS0TY_025767 [Phlomoides rotata]
MAPSIPLAQIYELQSRKHVEEDIMAMLREKKERMMGIGGMGGVGKTTMAKTIMSRAREECLFDEIVMVVVSQPVYMSRIQQEMLDLLGMKEKVDTESAKADKLRTRLMNSTNSVLIILDDVWENLNLVVLGIPDPKDLKDCTILLTSRNAHVFREMNVEKTFQMINLKDEEAWSLFREKVGACADDPNLFSTAQQIVGECDGLPLALVVVGGALKDETYKAIWENSLQALKSCNPDIQGFRAEVYKLSYDLLQSDPAKLIFLMCCLFPEDHEIRISDLSLYVWGLRKFDAWGLRVLGYNLVCYLTPKPHAAFGMLEYLKTDGYDSISSLWCDQIPMVFFTRLVDLTVCNCGDIKSLFSPSIAENLVNIRQLNIFRCGEMVKVIEEKVDEVERYPFIKLEVLILKKLPKLKAFCDLRCAIELPSLRRVYIQDCPEMEGFSSGSITSPNLEDIRIDREDIYDALLGGNFLQLEILFGSD